MNRFAMTMAALAVAVPAVCTIVAILTIEDWFLPLIAVWIFYPMMCVGFYMAKERTGSRWINGVDFSKYSEPEIGDLMCMFGLGMSLGSAVLMLSISFIAMSSVGIYVTIIGIAVALACFLLPLALGRPGRVRKMPELTAGMTVTLVIGMSVVAVVPSMLMAEGSVYGVEVEFGEDEFTVDAPMEHWSFKYHEIEELALYPDFDKGSRVVGYATLKISSGTYRTDFFDPGAYLKYDLASYTAVKMCVTFWVDGHLYAFNLSDEASTMAAYAELENRVPRQGFLRDGGFAGHAVDGAADRLSGRAHRECGTRRRGPGQRRLCGIGDQRTHPALQDIIRKGRDYAQHGGRPARVHKGRRGIRVPRGIRGNGRPRRGHGLHCLFCSARALSLLRMSTLLTLPEMDLGSSFTKSTALGYL